MEVFIPTYNLLLVISLCLLFVIIIYSYVDFQCSVSLLLKPLAVSMTFSIDGMFRHNVGMNNYDYKIVTIMKQYLGTCVSLRKGLQSSVKISS